MAMRNWMFTVPFLMGAMLKLTDDFANDIELADHPALTRDPA